MHTILHPLGCKGCLTQTCLSKNRDFIVSCNGKVQELIFGHSLIERHQHSLQECFSSISFLCFVLCWLYIQQHFFKLIFLTSLATPVEREHCFPSSCSKNPAGLSLDWLEISARPEFPCGQRNGRCVCGLCALHTIHCRVRFIGTLWPQEEV